MYDTADDAAIIRPLDPAHIRRQMRFDPLPLLIAKPKQVPGHDPNPLPKTNQDRIVRAEKLMSSDPSCELNKIERQGAAWLATFGCSGAGLTWLEDDQIRVNKDGWTLETKIKNVRRVGDPIRYCLANKC